MHATPISSIVCFLLAALVGAVGQYLYQSGATATSAGWMSMLVSPGILGGVVCYIVVMVLFVVAFRIGGSMAVLYPLYASTFIWAAVIARVVYQTPISVVNVCGWVLLILGMACMGWGSESETKQVESVQMDEVTTTELSHE